MATMVWKFVDSPVAVPATLFDMNNGIDVNINMSRDFDISPPVRRRTKASNLMRDGALLTDAPFDNRILKFSIGLGGSKTNKLNNLENLATELAKPNNLIMYKPDASMPPTFYRTSVSDDYVLTNSGGSAEVWHVDVIAEADPFGIGLRRDLATFTINNDPAAASGNKTFIDITGIVGDAPAPPFVKISSMGLNESFFIAQRVFNNPQALTLHLQAESANTLGADTTVITGADSSSVVPGTGNSKTQTTFATQSGMVARLTFNNAPTSTDPAALRGRYRVIVRCAGSSAINVGLRWRQATGGDTIPGPRTTVDLGTFVSFVDLGVIEFPAPQITPQYIGYSGLTSQAITQPLVIEAARNSGVGNLVIDYVYLLPADERLCAVFQLKDISTGWVCLDVPNEAVYGLVGGSTPFGTTRILSSQQGIMARQGGLPLLVPNVTNRWYTLFRPGSNGETRTFDISYWPQWRSAAMV